MTSPSSIGVKRELSEAQGSPQQPPPPKQARHSKSPGKKLVMVENDTPIWVSEPRGRLHVIRLSEVRISAHARTHSQHRRWRQPVVDGSRGAHS